jgi:template-activating factor I
VLFFRISLEALIKNKMSLLMRRKIFKPNENCSEIPFNKEITNTLNELAIVQCSIKKLNQQAKNEINQTKTKFENHRKHLCEKRSKQIEKIPNFWLTAFKNNQEIHGLFEDSFMSDDEEDDDDDFPAPFQHFKRFEVVEFEKSPSLSNKRGFKLNFYFNPRTNPFFKNRVIFKEFRLDKYDCYTCKSSDIDWDPHYKVNFS